MAVGLLPWATTLYLALLVSAFSGVGMVMVMVQASANTTYQTAPENLRGRVLSVAQALLGASSFLAMGLAGFAAEWIWLTAVLGIAGLAAGAAGVLVFLWLKGMGDQVGVWRKRPFSPRQAGQIRVDWGCCHFASCCNAPTIF